MELKTVLIGAATVVITASGITAAARQTASTQTSQQEAEANVMGKIVAPTGAAGPKAIKSESAFK